jgi:2-phospho-L-lactate transferase/gluconeogenesis factor (CofD/UPF0052 family)
MNVLIFSGGTGSVAIQTGLHQLYGNNVDVRVITNTQDNGKSTGTVRKVLDGKINGPSDLRKNQVLRYELKGGNANLIHLLNRRFNCASQEAKALCLSFINNMSIVSERAPKLDSLALNTMIKGVETYFSFPKSLQVDYVDFSLANIIYAGLAAENFSLAEAGKIMARNVMQIPEDAIIVADDKPLYLQARTQSGRVIADEGDIVDWNNVEDKIIDTFFVDEHGHEATATLTSEAQSAINQADIIIFSSGTQWSSLIPTYQHLMFDEAIKSSSARKYLIVNNVQDKDMAGVNATEMLSILGDRYLNLKEIVCVFNTKANPDMQPDDNFMKFKGWNYISEDISEVGGNVKVHDGRKLAKIIMFDYYWKHLKNDIFVFDYDDTLVGRNSTYNDASRDNKDLFLRCSTIPDKFFSICTGNSIKAINFKDHRNSASNVVIYAECGVNRYELKNELTNVFESLELTLSPPTVLAPEYIFSQKQIDEVMETLEEIGINISKIQNRNNAIISIKPIDVEYRKPLAMFIQMMFPNLAVRITGRTTIDISLGATKDVIMKELSTFNTGRITVVGDESHEGGNDYSLAMHDRTDFIDVKNPKDTNVFLTTLSMFLGRITR